MISTVIITVSFFTELYYLKQINLFIGCSFEYLTLSLSLTGLRYFLDKVQFFEGVLVMLLYLSISKRYRCVLESLRVSFPSLTICAGILPLLCKRRQINQ